MLKRIRASHPFLYCIWPPSCSVGHDGGPGAVPAGAGPAGAGRHGAVHPEMFLLQCVNELFGLGAGVFLLWRTGRLWVYRQRGRGFLDGCCWGWSPLCCCASPQLQPGGGRPCAGRAPAASVADRGVLSLHVPHQHGGGDRVPGASSARPCWNTSAPAGPASGKPACFRGCCSAQGI